MSRAFVKEGTGELEPLPDLPISAHPNYVTARGLAVLKARLLARQGDLAALRARAERLDRLPEAAAERDIRYLEARLRSAILVEAASPHSSEVAFGCRVVVEIGGAEQVFEIVGEDEADAELGPDCPAIAAGAGPDRGGGRRSGDLAAPRRRGGGGDCRDRSPRSAGLTQRLTCPRLRPSIKPQQPFGRWWTASRLTGKRRRRSSPMARRAQTLQPRTGLGFSKTRPL